MSQDEQNSGLPERRNEETRRTHWRGFLREVFSRHGSRYLDLHLDPLGAPSPAKHVLRPIFLAAMATGTLNAMSSGGPLQAELPLHLGVAALTYAAAREMVKKRRELLFNGKNQLEFNFGASKVIDTKPSPLTPMTAPHDLLKAMKIESEYRFSTLLGVGFFGIVWGSSAADILLSTPSPQSAMSTAMDVSVTIYNAYLIMRHQAMKNIANGNWVITSEPPAKRQEQVEHKLVPSFTFAQPSPMPART